MNIYTDEAGSMRNPSTNYKDKYFYISLIVLDNKNKVVNRRKKRYVSKNVEALKEINNNRKHLSSTMFDSNDKFIELKSVCLNPKTKFDILDYCLRDIEKSVFLCKVINDNTKPGFFKNTANAYNFILKNALIRLAKDLDLHDEPLIINIDNRNVANNNLKGLEQYLQTELLLSYDYFSSVSIVYHESENCNIVQLADLVAGIHFASVRCTKSREFLLKLGENGTIIRNYTFAYKKYEKK